MKKLLIVLTVLGSAMFIAPQARADHDRSCDGGPRYSQRHYRPRVRVTYQPRYYSYGRYGPSYQRSYYGRGSYGYSRYGHGYYGHGHYGHGHHGSGISIGIRF